MRLGMQHFIAWIVVGRSSGQIVREHMPAARRELGLRRPTGPQTKWAPVVAVEPRPV